MLMRSTLGLFTLFCLTPSLYATTSEVPCQNALYYARDVTHQDEILICHTTQQRYLLLYGPAKSISPYIDTTAKDTQLSVVHNAPGQCQLTFDAPPHRWVLVTHDNTIHTPPPDTLELYQAGQWTRTVTLSQPIRLAFLRELRQVREMCE